MRQRDYIWITRETPGDVRRRILAEVAAETGVPIAEMMGYSRMRPICEARWRAWHRLRTETNKSLKQIGDLFGRDHTTVMNGLRRYQQMDA